ncbi:MULTISPECIES: hypothetical protein [Bacillus]|nr:MULTISPECIES: hypothetical protein [Bacillus]
MLKKITSFIFKLLNKILSNDKVKKILWELLMEIIEITRKSWKENKKKEA